MISGSRDPDEYFSPEKSPIKASEAVADLGNASLEPGRRLNNGSQYGT
jgi:hypothetical protein